MTIKESFRIRDAIFGMFQDGPRIDAGKGFKTKEMREWGTVSPSTHPISSKEQNPVVIFKAAKETGNQTVPVEIIS